MKFCLVFAFFVTMCYTVSPRQINPEGLHRLTFFDPLRNKRQDDRWIWGFVNNNGSGGGQINKSTTAETNHAVIYKNDNSNDAVATTTEATNPCSPFVPPTRDFNAPGRRISVVKCYEYLWSIKVREDQSKHTAECLKYKALHRGPNSPHFAIGGRDTSPGEFPHMGAIGWKAAIGTWVFKCGSSLISEKFVLTAAHCSSASTRDTTIADPIPKIVRLGDKNIIDTGLNGQKPYDENIIKIITHPQYAAPKKYFDIALMELENAVSFDKYIQPACLWDKFDVSGLGKQATLTGWGVIETGGRTTSPELQAAVVDVIDSQLCDQLLRGSCNRHWCGVQDHQICAGKLAGGVDACQGDSGGPLQVKIPLPTSTEGTIHYVIGVTSFGVDCALPNLPGIYTRVSSFVDWIEENVWKNNT